jgi:hypothetical protein
MVSISRYAVAVGEGSSRQSIFSGCPTLSLFDMLLAREGFKNLMFPLWFALLWVFCLLGHGSFHFVPCIPLFWVLMISRVSSSFDDFGD